MSGESGSAPTAVSFGDLESAIRDAGDVILGWTRPMSDTERMAVLRAWWNNDVEPMLQAIVEARLSSVSDEGASSGSSKEAE